MIIIVTKEQIKQIAAVGCSYCGAPAGQKCKPKRQYRTAIGHVDRYPWGDSHSARCKAAGVKPDAPYHSRPRS